MGPHRPLGPVVKLGPRHPNYMALLQKSPIKETPKEERQAARQTNKFAYVRKAVVDLPRQIRSLPAVDAIVDAIHL